MARARNIKPGFFKNDELAEISAYGRLLFAGLWTIADRSGRLEDRVKRIKAEVLPYDDVDVDALLDALDDREFIIRYEVDGSRYIQIINWDKHQNPHKNEAFSEIPEYSYINRWAEQSFSEGEPSEDESEPEEHPTSTIQESEKHSTSTVQTPEEHTTNRADSFNLIPDSLSLLKDISTSSESKPKSKSKAKAIDYEAIIDKYHELCPSLPKVQVMTDKRKKAISNIISTYGIDKLEEVMKQAEASDFLSGRAPTDRPWSCNIDWILENKNFVKILEGNYQNKTIQQTKPMAQIGKGNKFHNFDQTMGNMSESDFEAIIKRKEAKRKANGDLRTAESRGQR